MYQKCWPVIYITYIFDFITVFLRSFCHHSYASTRRSQGLFNKRFVLLSPITDWNDSPQVFSFIPVDLIVHICYMILSYNAFTAWLRIWAVKSNRERQDLLSDWVKWFPFYKVCLPSLNLSDSYEFSNGNLASCVLTKIALPTHLREKNVWSEAYRSRHTQCASTTLSVNNWHFPLNCFKLC